MQALARALTTSADPAQVADAVFGALRDELNVDAAAFATTNERGVLCVHRRFGYRDDESDGPLVAAMEPDGELAQVLSQRQGFFADSVDQQRGERPLITASLDAGRFNSYAVVPLVVSDHAVGAVVVQWVRPRSITEADKRFLFTITGAAAQAVERARLTLTEFINLERSQHLHHLSSALAAATTPGEVAREAIASGHRALGAQSAACRVPVAGGQALSCLASNGHPALLSSDVIPVDHTPSGSTFTSGRTLTTSLASSAHRDADVSPEIVHAVMAELGHPVTIVTEPLMGSVGSLGVLTLAFVGRPEPSEPELRFLSTLAGLTAQALERAQLFEQERQALRDAEAARERLSLLSDVTRLLSSSLDPTTVIQRTMNLVVGRLSDACVVQVPGESGLQRLNVRAGETFESPAETRLIGSDNIPFDSDAPAAIAYRTGRIQLAPIIARDGDGRGEATALAVPFTANGQVIGVMTFFDGPGRTFEPDDVSLATEVASRTGVALSNATRFQREHVVAEVLQRAVLPDFLPTVGGLHLDAEYRAGAAGTYVGGDWYDVFQLDDDHVMFSVGDVMGKGAPAAALMGQVRSAIRALRGSRPEPVRGALLARSPLRRPGGGPCGDGRGGVDQPEVGNRLHRQRRAPFAADRPSRRRRRVLLHAELAPRCRGTGGTRTARRTTSSCNRATRSSCTPTVSSSGAASSSPSACSDWPMPPLQLPPGAGPNGRRRSSPRGSATTRRPTTSSCSPCATSVPRPGIQDRRLWVQSDTGMSTLHLEPIVESTPTARHWVAEQLRDVPADVSECAALLTSELVTNAVLHAATPFTVTLHLMADRIRVDVADSSPVAPASRTTQPMPRPGGGSRSSIRWPRTGASSPSWAGRSCGSNCPLTTSWRPKVSLTGPSASISSAWRRPRCTSGADTQPLVPVHLIGVPVHLLQKASEEYEALFRELRLMKEHGRGEPSRCSRIG